MIRLDLIKQAVASAPGTGAISLGSGQTGFIGIQDHPDTTDGMVVEYIAIDGNNKEFGIGTYSATGDVLTRTWIQGKIESGVYSKNPGTGVNLTANAVIQCGPVATNMNFRGCLIYNSTDQTTTNAVNATLAYNSEVYDTDNFHDTVTNNSRITIPANRGIKKVRLVSNIRWVSNSTGYRVHELAMDGATSVRGGFRDTRSAQLDSTSCCSSAIINVIDGSYFEIIVNQNSGGNLDIAHTDSNTWFALEVIE